MIDIGARIGIDGEAQYRKQISDIIKLQKELKSDMTATTAAFSANTSEEDKARAITQQLNRQLETQTQKLKLQNDQLRKMEQEGKGASAEANTLRANIAKTEAEIAKLNKELRENDQLAAFGRDLQKSGEQIAAAGDKMKRFGSTMTRHVTAPIAAAGAAAVKLATDFETSMAKLNSIADTSEVSLSDLEKQIMELSNDSGIAATDIAEQTYQAISAGRDTASSVRFVEETTRLARSGFADTSSALDVLTTILNAYGKSVDETESISDKLITTQNLGKTTVAQLAETMGQVIPTAAAYGVDLDNISSAYVTLTKQGVNTANATTQINNLMNQLGKSGTTASDIIRRKTGKSFKGLMQEGASLVDVLKLLQEAADEDGVALNDLFGNVRAGRAAMAIMNDAGVTFNSTLDEMASAAGATDTAFEKVTSTSAYKFERTLNQVKNTGIEAGKQILITFAPAIEKVGDAITKALGAFSEMSRTEQETILKTLAFAAAIGPATSALGGLTKGIGGAVAGAGKLIEQWALMGTVPVGGILGIVGAVTAVSAALAAAEWQYEKYNGNLGDMIRESEKVVESSKDLRDEIDKGSASYAESAEAIERNEKRADDLIGELNRLSRQAELTKGDQLKMAAAVDELNDMYPQLGLSIDSNTGKLNKNTAEIVENIKKLSEQARAVAAQERAIEINKQLFEIESELLKVGDQLTAARDAQADADKRVNWELEQMGEMLYESGVASVEAGRSVEALSEEEQGLLERQKDLNDQLLLAEQYVTDHAAALEETVEPAENVVEVIEDVSEELDEEAEAARKAAEEIMSHAELSVGAFEKVEKAQTKSIETIIENLRSQITAQQNYSDNLATLYGYIESDTEHNWDQVIKIIQDGGIGMAGELQGIADAINSGNTDILDEFVGLTLDINRETHESGVALNDLSKLTEKAMEDTATAIRTGKPPLLTEAKAAAQGTASSYGRSMTSGGQKMYTDTHTAFGRARKGITDSASGINSASESIGSGAVKSYERGTLSADPYNSSLAYLGQTKKGMIDHKWVVEQGADVVAAAAVKTMKNKYGETVQVGEYLADGLSVGLRNRSDSVGAVAGSVATVAINRLRSVPQVMSPSKVTTEIGEYIAQGLIVGMLNRINAVKAEAARLAAAALPQVGGIVDITGQVALNPDELYSAVREGASDATQSIYLNGRDLTRSLRGLGVAFTNG